jgi:hypothetical protein
MPGDGFFPFSSSKSRTNFVPRIVIIEPSHSSISILLILRWEFIRSKEDVVAKKAARAQEFKHGTRLMQGKCFDCSQGMLSPAKDGFEYWDENGEGRGHWFCRYCGSNHVKLTLNDGTVLDQGDLYDSDGSPTN